MDDKGFYDELFEKRYYYNKMTVQFILNAISEVSDQNDMLKVIGIDAAPGYGKSYFAKYIYNLLNKMKIDIYNEDNIKTGNKPPILNNNLKEISAVYISLSNYDYCNDFKHMISIFYISILEFFVNIKPNLISDDTVNIYDVLNTGCRWLLERSKEILKETKYAPLLKLARDINSLVNDFDKIKETTGIVHAKEMSNVKKDTDDKINMLENLYSIFKILEDKKVIIIVDNIDKCKPKFTCEFVDILKHITNGTKILFVMMVDFEYVKKLEEGIYGNTADLHHIYNLLFTRVTKMYLKNKNDFIDDLINVKENLIYFKKAYNDEILKNSINVVNKQYRLSLYEIEHAIIKFNRFIKKNQIYLEDRTDSVLREFGISEYLELIYGLIVFQVADVKLFNYLLYDEFFINKNESDNDGKKIDIFINSKFYNMIISFCSLREHLDSINSPITYYTKSGFFEYTEQEFDFKINESGTEIYRVLKYNNIKIPDSEIPINTFSISGYFNFEDLQNSGINELFNFTFREYLRYKISQI